MATAAARMVGVEMAETVAGVAWVAVTVGVGGVESQAEGRAREKWVEEGTALVVLAQGSSGGRVPKGAKEEEGREEQVRAGAVTVVVTWEEASWAQPQQSARTRAAARRGNLGPSYPGGRREDRPTAR